MALYISVRTVSTQLNSANVLQNQKGAIEMWKVKYLDHTVHPAEMCTVTVDKKELDSMFHHDAGGVITIKDWEEIAMNILQFKTVGGMYEKDVKVKCDGNGGILKKGTYTVPIYNLHQGWSNWCSGYAGQYFFIWNFAHPKPIFYKVDENGAYDDLNAPKLKPGKNDELALCSYAIELVVKDIIADKIKSVLTEKMNNREFDVVLKQIRFLE